MTEPVISLHDLEKRYGSVRALTGLTLDVAPGPVGLLGPNGAGKTTLLKLLLGQLRSNGGTARIAGHDPATRAGRLEVRRRVGYMPEGDCLIPRANAVDLIIMLGRLSGMSFRDAMTRTHEVLDYVGLEEARYRGLGEYSTGMKQRLKLAQALVHDPDILLLDEPTNGLDPKGRRHMLELVHDLGHAQEKNVLLCSHLLPDVERTCRDVVVIHRGRVLETGAIEEMTRSEETWLRIEVAGASAAFADELSKEDFAFEAEGNGGFRVQVRDGAEDGDELFGLAARCGASLTGLAPIRSTLEEVFLGALEDADE